jgi:hypothetical protein
VEHVQVVLGALPILAGDHAIKVAADLVYASALIAGIYNYELNSSELSFCRSLNMMTLRK